MLKRFAGKLKMESLSDGERSESYLSCNSMNCKVLVYITSTETIDDFVLMLHLLLPSLMWSVNIIKVHIVFIFIFFFFDKTDKFIGSRRWRPMELINLCMTCIDWTHHRSVVVLIKAFSFMAVGPISA